MPYSDNNGIKIFYDTYGTGVPVVFLHPSLLDPRDTLGSSGDSRISLGGLSPMLNVRPLRLLTLLANDSAR
jgi:hypothetical protein